MAVSRLAGALIVPFLIASALAAETTGHPHKHARHVVPAPTGPVREAPHHRAGKKPEHPPAAAEKKPEEPKKAEAAKPAKPPPPPPNPNIGTTTGLPLPRFASLRADEVNFRAGPGDRYPVQWVYKRRGLPVEIEREFDVWRLVQAPDGTKGWAHEATLMGRRDFVVTGGEHTMRAAPRADARAVAVLKPGVVGLLKSCPAQSDWCRVEVDRYRGWIRRADLWGVLPGEAVKPG